MITREMLVDAGAEKLADILVEIYKSKSIQSRLNVLFSTLKNDPQDMITSMEKELSNLDDLIDNYADSDDLAESLERLRGYILNKLAHMSLPEAVKMMNKFMELYSRVYLNDNEGNINEVFLSACEDMKELHKKAGSSLDEITDFLIGRLTEDDCSGIFDYLVPDYKEILGADGLDLLKQKFEQTLSNKNWHKEVEVLRRIADIQNETEEYIKVYKLVLQKPCTWEIDIAEKLLEHSCFDEALYWLDSFDLSMLKCYEYKVLSVKVKILDKQGKYDEAQMHRIQLLELRPCKRMYDEILENYDGTFYAEKAIEKALLFPDVDKAVSFLLEINNTQALSKLLRMRLRDLKCRRPWDLISVANALEEYDTLGAILLCRKLIEVILENDITDFYFAGVKCLILCEKLSSKISSWNEHESHIVYRTLLKQRFENQTSFWTELNFQRLV